MHEFSKKRNRVNENSSILWHKQLGHISRERMECLIKDEILTSLNFSDFTSCVECIKGKYTKVKKNGALRATELLECIHSDIWGPYSIPTINGHKYFISFIDDFSRYSYVYLIREKFEAIDAFKIYKAEVENQLNRRIKSVRFDKGDEYYGRFTESGQHLSVFALFLREHRIIANYTMPGTLEQNGVAV